MLPKFSQIVNRLYAFIYETKHSKSGLGLPSIVALVMTIDKSWTTISNRNSEEFLDGLFAFIKHCKPLLHPITQKIRCPCSRCCNRDDNRVTLEILEGYVAEEALTFCSRYLKDDVETRFNRLGRNDDGLPEEEPNKFQVFRSACKLTGRMKATRLTTDVKLGLQLKLRILWRKNKQRIKADHFRR
ncbi:zinc finger, CCHC-type containing protein, partial [Tanacetum coccineum]